MWLIFHLNLLAFYVTYVRQIRGGKESILVPPRSLGSVVEGEEKGSTQKTANKQALFSLAVHCFCPQSQHHRALLRGHTAEGVGGVAGKAEEVWEPHGFNSGVQSVCGDVWG